MTTNREPRYIKLVHHHEPPPTPYIVPLYSLPPLVKHYCIKAKINQIMCLQYGIY